MNAAISTWLRRLVCLAQGHNLVGVKLPQGWSVQRCRTCDKPVRAFRRDPGVGTDRPSAG